MDRLGSFAVFRTAQDDSVVVGAHYEDGFFVVACDFCSGLRFFTGLAIFVVAVRVVRRGALKLIWNLGQKDEGLRRCFLRMW